MTIVTDYELVKEQLRRDPRTWLVTGVAGFIGSSLLEELLALGQVVIGLDDLSTGHRANLDDALAAATARDGSAAARFRFEHGSICDPAACRAACYDVDVVLHQAALGSVPRSMKEPLASHHVNVDGFVNMVLAARDADVARFVYASSSSVYGDHVELPKVEGKSGEALSPYAATKQINEIYANVFQRAYGLEVIGLRYFNVFGPRQDPNGAYAAVIPRWTGRLLRGEPCEIYGDGQTSRDFCYVANAVQANVLAATAPEEATHHVYNVGCQAATTLDDLFRLIRERVAAHRPQAAASEPVYREFRPGDVRHSLADVGKAERLLGYQPTHTVDAGLAETVRWFADHAEAES